MQMMPKKEKKERNFEGKKERNGEGKGQGVHYANRGRILDAPTNVVETKPAQLLQFQIGMRNNTHYAYKPECHFVSILDDAQKALFDEVKVPVEQVQAMTDYKLDFALKVKDSAVPCALTENNKEFYEVKFQLQNPKGKLFGEELVIKVRVDQPNQASAPKRALEQVADRPTGVWKI
jgi:hypothetical protein